MLLTKNKNFLQQRFEIIDIQQKLLMKHNLLPFYKVAKSFKEGNKKVCIVHATGTGKSFITLKFLDSEINGGFACATGEKTLILEGDKNAKILYLAPTNVILHQFEKKIKNKKYADKIDLKTYAALLSKLKNDKTITDDNISEQHIDEKSQTAFIKMMKSYTHVVLDEFHRVDENEWGKAVKIAIESNPELKVLGLSATPVRSSGKDTAESLFENNVVSTISLADAIEQGILPMPDYYTAVYSYDKIISDYEKRIARLKNNVLRKEYTQMMNDIKKEIANADGFEKILVEKLKEQPNGKFIVFSDDIESSRQDIEKISHALKGKVKINQIYEVNSENDKSMQILDEFEKNNGEGIKLLFSVNMLNEGVHVKNDGVIMLRNTNSFIVFQQQLGRALSAGNDDKNKQPLVLDFVNNVISAYDYEQIGNFFGGIKGNYSEKGLEIQNLIMKLVKEDNILMLLSALDKQLSNTFEDRIYPLRLYMQQTGKDLSSIKRTDNDTYKINEEKINIYNIISGLRKSYKKAKDPSYNTSCAPLTDEQIKILEDMGMVWDAYSFEDRIKPLKIYMQQTGKDLSSIKQTDNDTYKINGKEINIYNIISGLRQAYKKTKDPSYNTALSPLTDEQIKILEDMGMVWDARNSFEDRIKPLKIYMQQTGKDLSSIKSTDNDTYKINGKEINIYTIIKHLRQAYKKTKDPSYNTGHAPLTDEQIKILEDMGMVWDATNSFEDRIKPLKIYMQKEGKDLSSIKKNETYLVNGKEINIYNIISGLRKSYKKAKDPSFKTALSPLTDEQIKILEYMGMIWDARNSFEDRIKLLKIYMQQTGKDLSSIKQTDNDTYKINGKEINIYNIIAGLRQSYKKTKDPSYKTVKAPLTDEQIKILEDMGMVWDARKEKKDISP